MDRIRRILAQYLWLLPVVVALIWLLLPSEAFGRPGGGHSYSGGSSSSGGGGGWSGGGSHSSGSGSHSSGGGGGGDGGEVIVMLISLIIQYPYIGLPTIGLIILFGILRHRRQPEVVISTRSSRENELWRHRATLAALDEFRDTHDPEFSKTIFLDFAQHLYHQFHYARGTTEILNLRPYFNEDILQKNSTSHIKLKLEVSELVVGSLEFGSVRASEKEQRISILFDANYSETIGDHTNRLWVKETWVFVRAAGVHSHGPEAMETLGCPNCGAALDLSPTGECNQCKLVVPPGSKTWTVDVVASNFRQPQEGSSIGTYQPEVGTNLPTVYDHRLNVTGPEFVARHHVQSVLEYANTFRDNIVKPTFITIYSSWSERKYEPSRPLMTDNLFKSHHYWIQQYQKAKLINRLDDLQVTGVHLVKLEVDKYFEAATVRIFASVRDYCIREDGKPYSGNPRSPRRFSEYWTFVRRAGVEVDEKKFDPKCCPNCGAPVSMGMTGICSYCNTKVTTGEFGWILSRITQDEAYLG
jgi:hypothetical protein